MRGEPHLAFPVILNLFQDPSRRKPFALRREAIRAVCEKSATTGQDEKWVLKQVQDDGKWKKGRAQ